MPKRLLRNQCLENYTTGNHLRVSVLTPGPHESKVKVIAPAPRTSLAAEVGSIRADLVYDIKQE